MSLPPSQSDDEDRERRVFVRAIRKLPRRPRDVFVLHRFASMPLEQIAKALGVEKETVEMRLFDTPEVKLHKPADLKARVALEEAERHYEQWMASAASFRKVAAFCIAENEPNLAAFNFHQTAEHLYHAVLLVVTLYSGKAHNLAFLRKKAEAIDVSVVETFGAGLAWR